MANKFKVNHNNKTNIIFKKEKKFVLLWLESGGCCAILFIVIYLVLEKFYKYVGDKNGRED